MKNLLLLCFMLLTKPLCGLAQHFPVDTLLQNGPVAQCINLVYVAEGYQAQELPKFIADARHALDGLLAQTPFKEYRSYFNAYAIRVPSAQSGATHAGGLADCGTQPVQFVDNYFGTRFDTDSIHRLLYPTKLAKVYAVLAATMPSYDQVFIVVNTPYYGGSGGSVATFSTDAQSQEVSVHELGHSFAGLGDEYWVGLGYARERPNMTQQAAPDSVRWKSWLSADGVGVYPYPDNYTSQRWYKPHTHCKMQNIDWPFCSVCTDALVEAFHATAPALTAFSPPDTLLSSPTQNLYFKLSLLAPSPNTLRTTWTRNGVPFVRNQAQAAVPLASLPAGSNKIQVEVVDTTALTRQRTHFVHHMQVVSWTITGVKVSATHQQYYVEMYPNPVSEFLTIFYTLPLPTKVDISVYEVSGRKLKTVVRQAQAASQHQYQLTLPEAHLYQPGLYLVVLELDGHRFSQKIVRE